MVGRFDVSTDDAYVQADSVTVAPKVSGYLGEVLVGDNEAVKAGQVLTRIDDRDYRVSVDQAKADVLAALATIETAGPLVVAAGFLLLLRIGEHTAYVSTVLPGLVVAALGMACAVAPLTTAVLGSVDERHSGSASGFNSAVARAGSLVATSLIGGILAARGPALVDAFHVAIVANVVVCIAASAGGRMLERR